MQVYTKYGEITIIAGNYICFKKETFCQVLQYLFPILLVYCVANHYIALIYTLLYLTNKNTKSWSHSVDQATSLEGIDLHLTNMIYLMSDN